MSSKKKKPPEGRAGIWQIPRRSSSAMLGLFCLLLLCAASNFLDSTALRGDKLGGNFETAWEEGNPVLRAMGNLWNAGVYAFSAEGLPGVLIAENRRMYTAEEWSGVAASPHIPNVWEFIAAVEAELRGQGRRLVVLLLPAKARVEAPQSLPAFPPDTQQRYARSLQQLETLGVDTVDLLAAFHASDEELFLSSDTHWNSAGAALAARTAAESAPSGTVLRPDSQTLPLEPFHTSSTGLGEHRGDLMNFLPEFSLLRPLPQADKVAIWSETRPASNLGLFDSPSIYFALVGTSYSANRAWNFAAFLRQELQSDVLLLAEEGRGPFEPMQDALENGVFATAGSETVLWEIPERYLPTP